MDADLFKVAALTVALAAPVCLSLWKCVRFRRSGRPWLDVSQGLRGRSICSVAWSACHWARCRLLDRLFSAASDSRSAILRRFSTGLRNSGHAGIASRQRAKCFRRFDWVLAALVAASMVANIPAQSVWRRDAQTGGMIYDGFADHLYHVGQAYELSRHIPPRQATIRGGSPERAYHNFMHLTTMLIVATPASRTCCARTWFITTP